MYVTLRTRPPRRTDSRSSPLRFSPRRLVKRPQDRRFASRYVSVENVAASRRIFARQLGALHRDVQFFASKLSTPKSESGSLLILGGPRYEPWHFTAHLSEQAERMGRRDLIPRLVRWDVRPDSPPQLSFSIDQLREVDTRNSVLVIDPIGNVENLKERVSDAKRRGLRVLSMHRGDHELSDLSHETLEVGADRPFLHFDLSEHLVSMAASLDQGSRWWRKTA